MDVSHAPFLLSVIATHAMVGYGLAQAVTDGRPLAGAFGAIAPDVDLFLGQRFAFPLVHRGVTHTPPFAVALVAGVYVLAGRRWATAVGIGIVSHLVIDTFTATGIAWLYPASDRYVGVAAGIHGPVGTVVLWVLSVGLLAWSRRARRRRATRR